MNYQKEASFSISNEIKPEIVYLKDPINTYGQKNHKVMSENSFVEFVLKRKLSRERLHEEFGIPIRTVSSSWLLYRDKYKKELREIKHYRYSNALKGNTHGAKEHPAILLNEADLREAVEKGKKLSVIAKEMKVSDWYIKENMRFYGIRKDHELPYIMQHVDWEYLEKLEIFSPGIIANAKTFYDNPHKFFLSLYDAFSGVLELTWFIKQQSQSHSHFRETNKIPKDHICWCINRFEMRLSKALLHAGIPHLREYSFYKHYRADFAFPEYKLLVELDGDFHLEDPITIQRDKIKSEKALLFGWQTERFSTKEVMSNTPCIVQKIKNIILEKSKKSLQKENSVSGI